MNQATPKGFRLHIGIFGRRNVGKSSIINAITGQAVSIVSEYAGTTTDPVEKPMELLPLGPVLFIDTAGIDDIGELGQLRIDKTRQAFDRTDLGIIVTTADSWGQYEEYILAEFQKRNTPVIAVLNKSDIVEVDQDILLKLKAAKIKAAVTSTIENTGLDDLRQNMLESAPEDYLNNPAIVGDLVGPGQMAVLVVPIDKEAPKGRLILPQVQSIRDLLDSDAYCMVVKERELTDALNNLKRPPKLVVTDSQAFLKVNADTPRDIMMTSFSILFARYRGDLTSQVIGAAAIEKLKKGDKVLIAESCTHHPIGEDIGRVKIPRWMTQYVGEKLEFTHYSGHDFPDNLAEYKLVIHCGACMNNRRLMLSRIMHCKAHGVPITNYGLAIAYTLGIFNRALEPFPAALDAFNSLRT
ncbi:MAG: [FeFe] hydrogenase H-cluster maturation GTPase HydF [Phycisphaerae bacterium]|nr:[FeFe] hydrogenase H-cluster maturation GTPase HydF [Phycisphaerae bacterium]